MPTPPAKDSPDSADSAGSPQSPYSPATPSSVPPVAPSGVPPVPLVSEPALPVPYGEVPGEQYPYSYASASVKPPTTLSLLSMIFGIVGALLSCCYGIGFLFGVAAIVLGHLGRKRENAQGMSLTGLITGYTSVALSLVMWVLLFILALSPLIMLPFLVG